ncbi:MAG: DUF1653 domain-containing protein [Deltaproteobacteria bacterium]|nr:DUF1653 domain-containing protein [Deltaproteobacteria bacterium]
MIALGRYRHFRGAEYDVIGVAHHSETAERLVVYRALYGGGQLYVRPIKMFLETVKYNGVIVPRFTLVD